jgi:hypothetical protein
MDNLTKKMLLPVETVVHQMNALQNYAAGMTMYVSEFVIPFLLSTFYFSGVERSRLLTTSPIDTFKSYSDLLEFILELSNKGIVGSMKVLNEFSNLEMENAISALLNIVFNLGGEDLENFMARQAKMMELVS